MEININHDSIVNEQTGVVDTPTEYIENLRGIERSIQRADDILARLKSEVKSAREDREVLVARLRGAVREGKVLPLFEAADEPPAVDDDVDDGLGLDDVGD